MDKVVKLNEKISLKERLDVSALSKQQRIVVFPQKKQCVIKHSMPLARLEKMSDSSAVILTKTRAIAAYPDLFFDSTKADDKGAIINKGILLTPEQVAFCARHGAVSVYIRELINKAMAKEAKKK